PTDNLSRPRAEAKLAWTMPRLGQVCKANQQDAKITANRKQRACSFAEVQRNLSKRNFKNTKKFTCLFITFLR
ncbi:MAG: hypothetical protein KBT41_07430, partial [bacterium]|nr:hypothetical protein [Candidatus Colousia faecequi]